MNRFLQYCAAALLACGGASCVVGIIYSDVTVPLSRNLKNTKAGSKVSNTDTKEIRDPFYSIRVQWDSNAIGDVMERNQIDHARFADIETESILFGIWTQQYVRVAGEKKEEKK